MLTKPDIWVRKIAAGESPLSPPKNVRPDSAPPRNHLEMKRGASGRARGEKCWRSTRRRQRCEPLVDDVQFCHESVAGSVVSDHRAVSSPVNGRSQSASASAGTPPPCPLSLKSENGVRPVRFMAGGAPQRCSARRLRRAENGVLV
jgi:hypothetical protein